MSPNPIATAEKDRQKSIVENFLGKSQGLPQPVNESRVRRTTYVADQLRNLISDGIFKPGDKLPTEEQLCKHYNVSRTTLRESVQMLRVAGLLDVAPGRGSFVTLPKVEDVVQDLALLGRHGQLDAGHAWSPLELLLKDMCTRACTARPELKRQLTTRMLMREATAKENALREQSWLLKMADLSQNQVCKLMLSILLNIIKPERERALAQADELMRVISVQIKLNDIIQRGDEEATQRVVIGYIAGCQFTR